jgi:hypothetical protein
LPTAFGLDAADDLGVSPSGERQQRLERARFLLEEPGAPCKAPQQRAAGRAAAAAAGDGR